MCTDFKIIPIDQAQKDAEEYPDSNGYIYYWRTSYGQIRRTGFVAICKCRRFQYWGLSKLDLQVLL